MNERIALYRDKMKVFWNNRKRTENSPYRCSSCGYSSH